MKADKGSDLHSRKSRVSESLTPVKVGHKVYLRNRPSGRKRIQDARNLIVYRVVEVAEDRKGYLVKTADGNGLSKRVNKRGV